ncbi:16S rRNA methyltransferase GidB [Moraxella macacae 0408225]|uniref:Ribosomal RNA small subunit methyltransferase G n=1 Tax=Moraxella macacae 0408225 TaxID=1230338 RepID=L2F5I8_9GAMM|nr:16S rRNA (guanine(527)-N(7))-methyltransferase RsmG [Moraxella macacae]ELA08150.1 16S rRNA methyltransferase GidB [Moraxella macacae 0408225]
MLIVDNNYQIDNSYQIDNNYQKLLPKLQAGLAQLNLTLSIQQQTQLLYYLQQLLFWNKAYNLTAIKQPEVALVKHILDSLGILPYLPTGRLLDIGTGAGLPAVVVAICQPDRFVTALDSNGKKVRFIKQISSELGLKNLNPVALRIEEHTDTYDVITSRAFASLEDFVALGADNLAVNGEFLAMKGVLPTDELAQLNTAWQILVTELNIPFLDEERHLIRLTRR